MRYFVFLLFGLFAQFGFAQAVKLSNWRYRNASNSVWYSAGPKLDLIAALENNGKLPNPYSGNEKLLAWAETQNWVFERDIEISDVNQLGELVFTGLDTYAKVYLNNVFLFAGDNAFQVYRRNVSKVCQVGKNVLRIEFSSPVLIDEKKVEKVGLIYPADSDTHPKKTSVFTRKPAYQFGWDFAPRRVNFRLEEMKILPVTSFQITELNAALVPGKTNKITLKAQLWSEKKTKVQVQFQLSNLTKPISWSVSLDSGMNVITKEIPRQGINLWWPNGLGQAQLYPLTLVVSRSGELEKRTENIGFKQFRIEQLADKFGTSFQFKVNGKILFAKGFNYIQTEKEVSELEVQEWARAGINTIRVWGGGNYGSDKLYELCDKYGILVWQDFMFANTMYPGDSNFLQSVKVEAQQQITRLHKHPCLALWCGNNEVEVAWKNWGWQQTYGYSSVDSIRLIAAYNHLFKQLLPQTVSELDPGRFYFSSSPISNWGKPDDFNHGDNHFWGVYHGEMPFEAYNTHIPRFASEYGMQSYPEMSTLHRFLDSTQLWLESPTIKSLQKSYKGNKLLEKYMRWYLGQAFDLEDFVYKTQVLQAEAMRIAISAHRRNTDKCSGSLLWQYNDVAPAASWSLVDFLGKPKAAYYTSFNAFSAQLISPIVEHDSLKIWLVNDQDTSVLELNLYLLNFAGDTLKSRTMAVETVPNSSELVYAAPKSEWINDGQEQNTRLKVVLSAMRLKTTNVESSVNLSSADVFFDTLKNVAFPPPEINYTILSIDSLTNAFSLSLSSTNLAKYVYVDLTNCPNCNITRNWNDLEPGSLPIEINNVPMGFKPEQLKLRSLGHPKVVLR